MAFDGGRARSDQRFHELFRKPVLQIAEVQQAAFGGVPDHLRAVVWKLLLGYLPLERSQRQAKLDESRAQYRVFLSAIDDRATGSRASRMPDLEQDLDDAADEPKAAPSSTDDAQAVPSAADSAAADGSTAAGPSWSDDEELQAEIDKDISRTNPDLDWFTRPEHTAPMRRILFVYAKLNSGVRYVQGMNELLAPLWFVIATERTEVEDEAVGTGDTPEGSHGAGGAGLGSAAGGAPMSPAGKGPGRAGHEPVGQGTPMSPRRPKPARESSFLIMSPSEAAATPSRRTAAAAASDSCVGSSGSSDSGHAPSGSDRGQPPATPQRHTTWRDVPLSEAEADTFYCFMSLMSEVRDVFITAHDNSESGIRGMLGRYGRMLLRREPALAGHLKTLGLDHQFYAMRWCMTLLTREFSFPEVVMLWDCILADPQRFSFLLQTCVAMIRLQKPVLLKCDFGRAMKLLQRYPSVDFLALLATSMEVRAEENADAAHAQAGGHGHGHGTGAQALATASAGAAAVGAAASAAASAAGSAGLSALGSLSSLASSLTMPSSLSFSSGAGGGSSNGKATAGQASSTGSSSTSSSTGGLSLSIPRLLSRSAGAASGLGPALWTSSSSSTSSSAGTTSGSGSGSAVSGAGATATAPPPARSTIASTGSSLFASSSSWLSKATGGAGSTGGGSGGAPTKPAVLPQGSYD